MVSKTVDEKAIKQAIINLMFRGDTAAGYDSDSSESDSDSESGSESGDECDCINVLKKLAESDKKLKIKKCYIGWGCESMQFYHKRLDLFLERMEELSIDRVKECKKILRKSPKDAQMLAEKSISLETQKLIKYHIKNLKA